MAAQLQPAEERQPGKTGRPPVAEPRNCVAYTRLTQREFDGLCSFLPPRVSTSGATTTARGSLSDLIRELLSEAVIARQLKQVDV